MPSHKTFEEWAKEFPADRATEEPDSQADRIFNTYKEAEDHKDWLEIVEEQCFLVLEWNDKFYITRPK